MSLKDLDVCLAYTKSKLTQSSRLSYMLLGKEIQFELDRMEREGVIKQDEQTPWVNSMVTVVKLKGHIRRCIVPIDLDEAIQREQ